MKGRTIAVILFILLLVVPMAYIIIDDTLTARREMAKQREVFEGLPGVDIIRSESDDFLCRINLSAEEWANLQNRLTITGWFRSIVTDQLRGTISDELDGAFAADEVRQVVNVWSADVEQEIFFLSDRVYRKRLYVIPCADSRVLLGVRVTSRAAEWGKH